jgi:tetratricopeptide (TPR) repeat protein
MIMSLCHRHRLGLVIIPLLFGAGGVAWPAAAVSPPGADASLMTAELSLQRGDCGAASQSYVDAARQSSDVRLAARAADVALDCGQFALAEQAAERWHKLAPDNDLALIAAVRAQLGRYRIAAARAPLLSWLDSAAAKDDDAVPAVIDLLIGRTGVDVTLALLRDTHHARLERPAVLKQLAGLAIDGWDFALALKYAERARAGGEEETALRALTAHARAGLGQADAALADARVAVTSDDDDLGLTVAETLLWLGRDAEARAELQRLSQQPRLRSRAERRLALLEFTRGEYRAAEDHFRTLLRDEQSSAMAVYYLAAIAERRGDAETALRSYELLINSGFDSVARRRVAGIYYRDGEQRQAVRLLSADDDASIIGRISAELTIADLLATEDTASAGAARLDSALQGYPGHPELSYQRAVFLERDDSNAAITAFEALARDRPADLGVANALGFTLADHNRDLARAEKLIRSALAAQPDSPAVLDSMGWVLYRRGQGRAALPYLERAFRLLRDGDIGSHYGEVLWQAGRQSEARTVWTEALASNPDNKYLARTAQRFVPDLRAPVPPPRLDPSADTTI